MDRSSNQKLSKETMALNDTLDQMDLTDIFRTFHPKAAEYTFFFGAHGMFSRIDHILGHKSALSTKRSRSYFHIHVVHIFRPQRYETLNQPQEKIWKGNKYLQSKQHPTKE